MGEMNLSYKDFKESAPRTVALLRGRELRNRESAAYRVLCPRLHSKQGLELHSQAHIVLERQ